MNTEFYKNLTKEQLEGFVLYLVTEEVYGLLPEGCEDNEETWGSLVTIEEGSRIVGRKTVFQTNIYQFVPTGQYFAIDFKEDNVGYWSGESKSYEPKVREVKPVQVSITKWVNV